MKKIDYAVGDFLIRLKNSAMAGRKEVVLPKTKLIISTANALKTAKYISDFKIEDNKIIINLSYAHKEPVLTDVKLISKPGLRIYSSVDEIKIKKGPSILIISTPKGVLTSKQAIKENVGGEIIAEIL